MQRYLKTDTSPNYFTMGKKKKELHTLMLGKFVDKTLKP
jgi:hypothetical protein